MTLPTESHFTGQHVLLERRAELGAVEELIGAVSRGGRLAAIEGPPGIGKTALLALVGQVLSDPLAAVVRPAVLSFQATAGLLRVSVSADAEDAFSAACHRETGGNPFLLRELVQAIAAEGLAPDRG